MKSVWPPGGPAYVGGQSLWEGHISTKGSPPGAGLLRLRRGFGRLVGLFPPPSKQLSLEARGGEGRDGNGRGEGREEGPAHPPPNLCPPPLIVCLCIVPSSLYLLLPLHPLPLPLGAHRIHNDRSVSSIPPQGIFQSFLVPQMRGDRGFKKKQDL